MTLALARDVHVDVFEEDVAVTSVAVELVRFGLAPASLAIYEGERCSVHEAPGPGRIERLI